MNGLSVIPDNALDGALDLPAGVVIRGKVEADHRIHAPVTAKASDVLVHFSLGDDGLVQHAIRRYVIDRNRRVRIDDIPQVDAK